MPSQILSYLKSNAQFKGLFPPKQRMNYSLFSATVCRWSYPNCSYLRSRRHENFVLPWRVYIVLLCSVSRGIERNITLPRSVLTESAKIGGYERILSQFSFTSIKNLSNVNLCSLYWSEEVLHESKFTNTQFIDECVMESRENKSENRKGRLFLWFNMHDWVISTFVWSGEISSAISPPPESLATGGPGGGGVGVQRSQVCVFHLTPVRQCREYFTLMPRNSARFILLNSFVSGPSGVVVSPPTPQPRPATSPRVN